MKRILPAIVLLLFAAPAWAGEAELTADIRAMLAGLPPLAGKKVTAENLKGRVVLVTFFASCCPPCHKEFRHLNDLHAEFGRKGFRIVSINQFEDYAGPDPGEDRLNRFLERYNPRFSVVRGGEAVGMAFEDVQRIPTVFIFDRTCTKRFHFIHKQGATKMNPTITELRAVLNELFGSGQPQ
jgi:thiol-disulfide isomerase/thioredoxin